jgi:hypothetical protein
MVPSPDRQPRGSRRLTPIQNAGQPQTQGKGVPLKPLTVVRTSLPALPQLPNTPAEQGVRSSSSPALRPLPSTQRSVLLPAAAVPSSRPLPLAGTEPATARPVDHLKPSTAISKPSFVLPSIAPSVGPSVSHRPPPLKTSVGESKRVLPEGKVTQHRGFLLVSEL